MTVNHYFNWINNLINKILKILPIFRLFVYYHSGCKVIGCFLVHLFCKFTNFQPMLTTQLS